MSSSKEPLRLDKEDLFSPRVDAYLEERDALSRGVVEVPTTPLFFRILYASWFYLAIAGGLGAFLAWLVLEPFMDESAVVQPSFVISLLVFPTVSGSIGLFLGLVDGIMCRNPQRAFTCAVVGLGIGFGLGLVGVLAAIMIFSIMVQLAGAIDPNFLRGQMPGRFAFLVLMMGRGAAWAVAAISAGVGQGIALKERKVVLNGLLGGVLGGLLGGLLFDPIDLLFSGGVRATLSRAVGFTVIGVMVGLFVGLVEQWTKTAWMIMRAGPLAGKQFVIHRNPTVLGSSPKADIYLFKDADIEPRHALIHNLGGRHEIEDCNTPDGTYVNGKPVQRQLLQHGDQIVLGKTVLEFALREAK
jgi:FHA domain